MTSDALDAYRRKRVRGRTPEPVPEPGPLPKGDCDRFVIREHHASSLHRDFRLERVEGVVAKRLDSRYPPGRRTDSWLKVKHLRTQEVVVVRAGGPGPADGPALSARCWSGSRAKARWSTSGRSAPASPRRRWQTCAADSMTWKAPSRGRVETGVPRPDARDAHWVRPCIVGEVRFSEWTRDGRCATRHGGGPGPTRHRPTSSGRRERATGLAQDPGPCPAHSAAAAPGTTEQVPGCRGDAEQPHQAAVLAQTVGDQAAGDGKAVEACPMLVLRVAAAADGARG